MKFQAYLLREFAIRYLIKYDYELTHIYLKLQDKKQEAISARNQGNQDGFIDMSHNVSVSVQDIITHAQNSLLLSYENDPTRCAKSARKHVDMEIDFWMQENSNIDILQDVVTSLGKKHKQGPLEIANYLKSKDFHNILQFFFQNGIDPCFFMYDVIRTYIGYGSDRNMLLYGPMMSGKTFLTNALGCILPACSSPGNWSWGNRYSFDVSRSRILVFDNATEENFKKMNKRCRSALKGQPIKVKRKYEKEQELPCPAVIVSTNLDPSEISEEFKSSFKIYNFYKPVTNAQVESLLNLEAFERFFVYIVCGHMATFWVKNGDPLFSDFADGYKDLYKLIEEFAPNPSTPFYDPTFSLLREMSPNWLQSRQSTTVVENNVLNSKRFLHIPSVLPQLNLVQRYMISNHEGKSVVLETSQCLKDSEAHKIVKVRDFFLNKSRANVMRYHFDKPTVIPDRFSEYLDNRAIDEEGIPRTTDRETDTAVPVASPITGKRKRTK